MSNLGVNIRRLRQRTEIKRTMTQADLAKETGLKSYTINRYERGWREPSTKNLIKLADALGVSIDDLVRGDFHD